MIRFALVSLLVPTLLVSESCGGGKQDVGSQAAPSATIAIPSPSVAVTSQPTLQGLYVVNADGSGQPRQIVDFATRDPRWSPDGGSLYFMGDATGRYPQDPPDVYVSSVISGKLTKLLETHGDPSAFVFNHSFSPDLSMVAYQDNLPGGRWGTWVIRVANLDDPTTDREVAKGIFDGWSSDSQFISYYAPACENESLFVSKPDGGEQLAAPYSENYLIGWTAWLPGGERLAYEEMAKTESGLEPAGAYVFDVATSKTAEAANLSAHGQLWFSPDGQPWFSPDGKWFVYSREEGMYLVRRDNGERTRINDSALPEMAWDSASDKLAYVQDGKLMIYTIADGSTRSIDLYLGGAPRGTSLWGVEVSWSPDDDRVAVAVSEARLRGYCD